ncbi:hypothetical protein TIFTF001_017795 [Ficus carica]|uniref:Uncharacterized protein n=1 Tax=Ficus carica TaxID=3494 RepID=A0AA88D7B2_FICCA|nr:hypothetical protein TIFTF001_017795 [Ficus carica]
MTLFLVSKNKKLCEPELQRPSLTAAPPIACTTRQSEPLPALQRPISMAAAPAPIFPDLFSAAAPPVHNCSARNLYWLVHFFPQRCSTQFSKLQRQ